MTITQEQYTKSLLERYGMTSCNLTYTPGVGQELSLDQPEERLLSKEEKQRFLAITGSVMYLGKVTRKDIVYAVNQLARAMSKLSKAHMAAAKHLLPLPGRNGGLRHHVQARWLEVDCIFRCKLGQQPG